MHHSVDTAEDDRVQSVAAFNILSLDILAWVAPRENQTSNSGCIVIMLNSATGQQITISTLPGQGLWTHRVQGTMVKVIFLSL